eukprot:g9292.t1
MTFQPDPSGKPVFATRSCGHYDVEASLCSPPPKCGRYIREKFISEEEVKQLRQLAESAMWHGGGSGPPTVFDVPSGALSHGNNFINLWAMLQEQADKGQPHPNRIDPDLMFTYLNVTSRVQNLVAKRFGIKSNQFGLTRPSFFSRMRGYVKPKTKHDEYWHEHIDTEQYGTFTLTVLIYLNQHGSDFQGGQFVFGRKPYVSTEKGETKGDKQDWQVNPKPGTLLAFSSGPENAHWVERVTSGERFALTIAFSCTTENHVTEHLTNLANTMREQEKQYEQEKQAGDGAAAPATSTAVLIEKLIVHNSCRLFPLAFNESFSAIC